MESTLDYLPSLYCGQRNTGYIQCPLGTRQSQAALAPLTMAVLGTEYEPKRWRENTPSDIFVSVNSN